MPLKPTSKSPLKAFKEAHWGIPARRVLTVPDQPGMPKRTTELGKLVEIELREGSLHFDSGKGRKNILAFDAPPRARLYLQITPSMKRQCKDRLIVSGAPWYSIKEVARSIGGRQAKHENRTTKVQALGRAIKINYQTNKKGDGVSVYTHALGEEGGIQPMLCVSATGQLFLVGGSATMKVAGVIQ